MTTANWSSAVSTRTKGESMRATLCRSSRTLRHMPTLTKRGAQSQENWDWVLRTQTRLATVYARTQRNAQATQLASKSELQARKMHYQKGLADALTVLGDLARESGERNAAKNRYAEAHRLYTILHAPAASRLADRLRDAEESAAERAD